MKKKTKKQFRKFVDNCLERIFTQTNLENYHGKTLYKLDSDQEKDSVMYVDTDDRRFELYIYRGLYKTYQYDSEAVLRDLCHGVGYIHTHDMLDLIKQPFKTEREVHKVDHRLAGTIGSYLYKLTWGKNKWQQKQLKKTRRKQKTEKP